MTTLGYYLGSVPFVQRNFEKVIFAIILISLLPVAIHALEGRRAKKRESVATQ
jgi:membrane-associated protein